MAIMYKIGYGFYLLTISNLVWCIVDDCSKNTYDSNDNNYMHFTKEPSNDEFAVVGKFKGLNCCAKGYRSIEWLKDGRLYSWPSSVSGLIVYPESANQTIYTQSVTADDAGNYTCLLKNDTTILAHTMYLKVFDKRPDHPRVTYISKNKEISVGHQLRLLCEAFVGVVDLPDAHSEAIWRKGNDNGSIDDDPRITQEKFSREDNQTFGSYLTIEEVTDDDFGAYICKITRPGGRTIDLSPVYVSEKVNVQYLNPNPIPWKKIMVWTAVFGLIILTLLILNMRFGLALRVKFKDRFGTIEEDDGKCTDVLITYSQEDSELVLGVLLPTLESQYNYKCSTREFPSNLNMWYSNLSDISKKSRRMIAVLSPASVNDQWNTSNVYFALKQLNSLNTHLTCITLQEVPKNNLETKNSQGETLASILRTLSVIHWDRESNEKFWLSLRLRLPSKRVLSEGKLQDLNMTQSNNSRRLTTDSQDSLDVLV